MNKAFPILGITLLILSCDLLRNSPYEVEAWTPGEGFHTNPQNIEISLLLSHESDKAKTEQAFSLTENRKTLKGGFSWKGRTLVFVPASPLEAGRDYLISLGTGAQNLKGLSLETKFEASFTTRPDGGKIKIIGTEPDYGEIIHESRGEFRVFFSEHIDLDSCLDYISFNPSTPGSWRLEDNNKTACFTPRETWQSGGLHKISINNNFAAVSGSVLGEAFSSVFYTGSDREKPVLLKAMERKAGAAPEEFTVTELTLEKPGFPETAYTAWENNSFLELIFSEPVNLGALKNLLYVEPNQSLIMVSPPGMSDRAIFRFAEYPQWGSSFLFRLGPGVKDNAGNESEEEYFFRICCGGPFSKAPALAGIRLPMAPGNIPAVAGESGENKPLSFSCADVFSDLPIINEHYPYMENIPSWIELYFETAPDTGINLFSIMDLFRVESTNQALSFSPRSVHADTFTWSVPQEGWENLQRVEIQGFLTNTVQSGVVTFRIAPGLADKRGNKSKQEFRISLLK